MLNHRVVLREHPTHWLISTQVASLLKARRTCASQFERRNRFDRDDAVAVETTPLVKEVRFDARTPASAIVSESSGDSPVVASPRKLYLDAACEEPVRGRSVVLLAAFVARDLAPRRQAPAPTPGQAWAAYVRASMELVDDIAMVPAIAPSRWRYGRWPSPRRRSRRWRWRRRGSLPRPGSGRSAPPAHALDLRRCCRGRRSWHGSGGAPAGAQLRSAVRRHWGGARLPGRVRVAVSPPLAGQDTVHGGCKGVTVGARGEQRSKCCCRNVRSAPRRSARRFVAAFARSMRPASRGRPGTPGPGLFSSIGGRPATATGHRDGVVVVFRPAVGSVSGSCNRRRPAPRGSARSCRPAAAPPPPPPRPAARAPASSSYERTVALALGARLTRHAVAALGASRDSARTRRPGTREPLG